MDLFHGRTLKMSAAQISARDALNNKIRSGEYDLTSVACLCGSLDFETLATHDRYGIEQPTAICVTCGLIQLNPRMSEESYRAWYSSDDYRLLYDGEDFEAKFRRQMTPQQGQRILWAVQRAGQFQSVVEIGAGAGWNLVAFQHAGFSTCGWDYSQQLTALGRSAGISMHQGGITEAIAAGMRYDAIVLNHVLEHFLDPVEALRDLRALLQPNGYLYVGVPATDYPAIGLLQSAHTYYFTDATLRHYMARAGWICGDIVHEDHYGMHAIARPGNVEPASLATEYVESLGRLRANRTKVRALDAVYRARALAARLTPLRTLYRRFSSAHRLSSG